LHFRLSPPHFFFENIFAMESLVKGMVSSNSFVSGEGRRILENHKSIFMDLDPTLNHKIRARRLAI